MRIYQVFFTISLIFFASYYAYSQSLYTYPDTTGKSVDPIKNEKAQAIAVRYLELLAEGDSVDKLIGICSIPFAWDRKEVISSMNALRKKYETNIAKKGKHRQFQIASVRTIATRNDILDTIIPIDVYYIELGIKTNQEKDRIRKIKIAVQMGDTLKIIGFSD